MVENTKIEKTKKPHIKVITKPASCGAILASKQDTVISITDISGAFIAGRIFESCNIVSVLLEDDIPKILKVDLIEYQNFKFENETT